MVPFIEDGLEHSRPIVKQESVLPAISVSQYHFKVGEDYVPVTSVGLALGLLV